MKKLFLLITLLGIIFLAILCKPSDNSPTAYNPPVDGTIVKKDAEDIPKKTFACSLCGTKSRNAPSILTAKRCVMICNSKRNFFAMRCYQIYIWLSHRTITKC